MAEVVAGSTAFNFQHSLGPPFLFLPPKRLVSDPRAAALDVEDRWLQVRGSIGLTLTLTVTVTHTLIRILIGPPAAGHHLHDPHFHPYPNLNPRRDLNPYSCGTASA